MLVTIQRIGVVLLTSAIVETVHDMGEKTTLQDIAYTLSQRGCETIDAETVRRRIISHGGRYPLWHGELLAFFQRHNVDLRRYSRQESSPMQRAIEMLK